MMEETITVADFNNELGRISAEHLGLYVHVPFCRARCRFCAFYMERLRTDRVQRFLGGVDRECSLYARDVGLCNVPVQTIYFGGGTPTALTAPQLIRILNGLRRWFVVDREAEISVEVHPGTVTPESLGLLRQAGFTRLSVGAQSFDQDELRELGGRAFGHGARQVVAWARSAGFTNISLDLLFGFPGQSLESWQRTLDEALAVSPAHLSCYAYTLEEGSPFYLDVMQGKGSASDQEFQVTLEAVAAERLAAAGFERYEISNYCQPHHECRHNVRYWQTQPWLGLGPSAQSCLGRVRFGNVADLERYATALEKGTLPLDDLTHLSPDQADRERVIWGLRMLSGVSVPPHRKTLLETIHQLRKDGLLQVDGRVRLTDRGLRYADTVAVAFL